MLVDTSVWVDHLRRHNATLASARLVGLPLWTLDKLLMRVADELTSRAS